LLYWIFPKQKNRSFKDEMGISAKTFWRPNQVSPNPGDEAGEKGGKLALLLKKGSAT